MRTVSLANAKAHLSELIAKVEGGETIVITKRGKVAVKLVAAEAPRRALDVERLRKHLESMPMQEESAGDFIRKMRDDERY